MPTVLHVVRSQSEGALWCTRGGAVYVELALRATRDFEGRTAFSQEISRRTGWAINDRGDNFAAVSPPPLPTRWGGTSFIDDWQAPSPGLTPYASNTDSRLAGRIGESYFASLDSILASHAAAADAILVTWFRQTWESADPSWTFNVVEYARAVTLFVNFEMAKIAAAAPGKPARVMVVMPGQTDRGGLNHALMREVHLHLAQNGRRSRRSDLAAFAPVAGFHIGTSATQDISQAEAERIDTGTPGTDFAHQSTGHAQRVGMAYALEVARWLAPSTVLEFERHPVAMHAFPKAGSPNTLRLRVRITPGNYLVWQGPDPINDPTLLPNGAFSTQVSQAHAFVHQTAILTGTAPTAVPVSAVSVDNGDRTRGWAYLDLALPSAVVPGYFVSLSPSQIAPGYTRAAELVAPGLKKKIGLFEAPVAAPDINGGFADLLASPPLVVLPVLHVTNLQITAQDPAPMADLTPAGITLVENWLRTQITHAGLRKSGTEVTAPGYARAAITWSANGQPMENTNQLDFGGAITDTGINEVAGYTASTGGSAIVSKAIAAQAPTAQTVRLAAGSLNGIAS
jgi:hypothetical protein